MLESSQKLLAWTVVEPTVGGVTVAMSFRVRPVGVTTCCELAESSWTVLSRGVSRSDSGSARLHPTREAISDDASDAVQILRIRFMTPACLRCDSADKRSSRVNLLS